MQRATHMQYIFVASPGPSAHEAGVALLIAMELAPRCRAYKRSKSGRLVGVVLELRKGYQLLIVSAYMPSGIDHRARMIRRWRLAHDLYAELITWTHDMHQVILLGDLNETLTPRDRFPVVAAPRRAAAAHRSSACSTAISSMCFDFFDRTLGWLHAPASTVLDHLAVASTTSGRNVSRCFTPCSAHRHEASQSLASSSAVGGTRRWTVLVAAHTRSRDSAIATSESPCDVLSQRATFVAHLERHVEIHRHHLSSLASALSPDSLSTLASDLTSLAHRSAYAMLPITGDKRYKSKMILRLERMRRDLTRALHIAVRLVNSGHRLIRCPEWARLYAHCLRHHRITWCTDAYYHHDDTASIHETRRLITRTRSSIAREKHRLRLHQATTPFDANPAAAIHRMIQSDALPSRLFSIIDSNGELTTSVQELEDVMTSHFESVFSIPPLDPAAAPLDPPPPAMLFDKCSVQREWYDELMQETNDSELCQLVADTPLLSAPGLDGVSTGVWKFAIEDSSIIREHVVELFSACLLTASFPSAWKTGVILPFIKDAAKDRTMINIRPITLQSCLGKLFFKLLARRLGEILRRHPILNSSQRGFVLGGTTMKCVDELLDAWEWSRNSDSEQYTVFYDIKQAYDCVQMPVLIRSMKRLRMPLPFIALIADSLIDLQSCVRTIYGETRCFPVRRSIRQGDPLAPLLFVILMDALHDGLEVNPFTQQRHGCQLVYPSATVELSSLGYADDTTVIANNLDNLRLQNDWVKYFMRFNVMRSTRSSARSSVAVWMAHPHSHLRSLRAASPSMMSHSFRSHTTHLSGISVSTLASMASVMLNSRSLAR